MEKKFSLNIDNIDTDAVVVVTGENSKQVKALYNMLVADNWDNRNNCYGEEQYIEDFGLWLPETGLSLKEQIPYISNKLIDMVRPYKNVVIGTFSPYVIVNYLVALGNANRILQTLDRNIITLELEYPSSHNEYEYKEFGIEKARKIFDMKKEMFKKDISDIKNVLGPKIFDLVNNRWFNVKIIDIVDNMARNCESYLKGCVYDSETEELSKVIYQDITGTKIHENVGVYKNVMCNGFDCEYLSYDIYSSEYLLDRHKDTHDNIPDLYDYILDIGYRKYIRDENQIKELKLPNLLENKEKVNLGDE